MKVFWDNESNPLQPSASWEQLLWGGLDHKLISGPTWWSLVLRGPGGLCGHVTMKMRHRGGLTAGRRDSSVSNCHRNKHTSSEADEEHGSRCEIQKVHLSRLLPVATVTWWYLVTLIQLFAVMFCHWSVNEASSILKCPNVFKRLEGHSGTGSDVICLRCDFVLLWMRVPAGMWRILLPGGGWCVTPPSPQQDQYA